MDGDSLGTKEASGPNPEGASNVEFKLRKTQKES